MKFLEVRSLLTKVEFWLSVYNLATRYCIHFRADNVMDGTPNVYLVWLNTVSILITPHFQDSWQRFLFTAQKKKVSNGFVARQRLFLANKLILCFAHNILLSAFSNIVAHIVEK